MREIGCRAFARLSGPRPLHAVVATGRLRHEWVVAERQHQESDGDRKADWEQCTQQQKKESARGCSSDAVTRCKPSGPRISMHAMTANGPTTSSASCQPWQRQLRSKSRVVGERKIAVASGKLQLQVCLTDTYHAVDMPGTSSTLVMRVHRSGDPGARCTLSCLLSTA